jgi:starch phosphorylase
MPADRTEPTMAYFSMEVAFEDALPTFSGGLGVLAADFLRSAADLGLPLVGVSLCYRDGYFHQRVDAKGVQHESPVKWAPADLLERLDKRVTVEIRGRHVVIGVWRKVLSGARGGEVAVYFLDTNLEENAVVDRSITDQLYGGDTEHRLAQEAVLGLGGPAMLAELGHNDISVFHMNEGHSALLGLRLIDRFSALGVTGDALSWVRSRCVFTTHTPVPAGHDRFASAQVGEVLGAVRAGQLEGLGLLAGGELNMTELGMACSGQVNAVAVRHREVSQAMFPETRIVSVTNGVHLGTWVAPSFAALYDAEIPGWRKDNALLRYASMIPLDRIAATHDVAKASLIAEVAHRTSRKLDPSAFTIGLARRATPYKQTTLVFSDLERLVAIATAHGPIQVVCAGKAHPADEPGKALIERLITVQNELKGAVQVVFLEDYNMELAKILVAGSDVWLNTPIKPREASGTSGMKAAANGVPSLSTLDGWWLEGWVEGVTGWAIGGPEADGDDAEDLYHSLEHVVLPLFYGDRASFTEVRRSAIALNASFFNTERMVTEYVHSLYDALIAGRPNASAGPSRRAGDRRRH